VPLFEMRKFVAPEIVFGVGARRRAAFYAHNLNARRVLVVSDPGVAAAGWLAELVDLFAAEGIETAVFQGVSPNPKDEEVMAGVEVYRQAGCDIIVALGGGSVIDCAKGIGIVSANGGHILDFEGVDNIPAPGPPLLCIPTTAGTSADISQFAIFADVRRRTKIAIISKSVVPDVALVDPETTLTMDPGLTACTGIDALAHGIEAFVSTASSPVVDVHALAAIRGVKENLQAAVANPGDLAARERMMLASLQAGLAFSNASLGIVHAMAHSLGGYAGLPHGECNALLLEFCIDFNFSAAEDRFQQVGTALGLDLRGLTLNEQRRRILTDLRDLRKAVNLDNGLANRGITSGLIDDLAEFAIRDPCIYTNPRRASIADVKVIYGEAL
jgi:alcohol dehydrogenase